MTDANCTVLFDFSRPADRAAWRAENDTVMGGNSRGRVQETEGSVIFAGDLVTRDGGFVQMNAPLPEGALAGVTQLRLVASGDGRPWRVRVQTQERVPRDAMRGRGDEGDAAITRSGAGEDGPRISFSAPLQGLTEGAPSVATADLTAPEPSVRGRPVPNARWVPSDASSLGLILSDGRDAPFRLEVRQIEACRD
jgi:hypothetical protein